MAHIGGDMPFYANFLSAELDLLNGVASIEGGYVLLPGILDAKNIIVAGKVFKVGTQIAHFLKHMTAVAIFVCTAGNEISERAEELTLQGELVEGYLVDLLGSVIVEKAMDKMQDLLKEELEKEGLKMSNRYSPGYCAWSVKEQEQLFSFFPKDFCHVVLSDSCLMSPIKTVSGMIAIGEDVSFHKHVCQSCNSVNCLYRDTNAECK